MARTQLSMAEEWARREMQEAASPAEREFMAMVTHRVASLFLPEEPKEAAPADPPEVLVDRLSHLRALAEGRK